MTPSQVLIQTQRKCVAFCAEGSETNQLMSGIEHPPSLLANSLTSEFGSRIDFALPIFGLVSYCLALCSSYLAFLGFSFDFLGFIGLFFFPTPLG